MEMCPLYFHSLTNPVRPSAGKEAKTYRVDIITRKNCCSLFVAFFFILLIPNGLYFKSLHTFLCSPATKKLRRHFCVSTNVPSTPTSASAVLLPPAGSHAHLCTDTDLYTSSINASL